VKELLRGVSNGPKDVIAIDMAKVMFRTATLRSGYMLQNRSDFADSTERMMHRTPGVSLDKQVSWSELHKSFIVREF
jgi:heat shock protein beta